MTAPPTVINPVKAVWDRIGGRVQDQTVVAVRAALSEEDSQLAWKKGEGMTLAEAAVYALESNS